MLSIFTLIIVSSALLQLAQRTETYDKDQKELQKLQFDYYIYFVLTSISTVGYENRFNKVESKILSSFLILFAILVIPSKSSELIHLLSSKSMYSRRNYTLVEETPHILITGIFFQKKILKKK